MTRTDTPKATTSAAGGEDDAAHHALAECWATMDGKINDYRREMKLFVDGNDVDRTTPDYTGHYEGYQCEAHSMIKRLADRGFVLARRGAQSSQPMAWQCRLNGTSNRWSTIEEKIAFSMQRGNEMEVRPLYAAPQPDPAPSAAPGEVSEAEVEEGSAILVDALYDLKKSLISPRCGEVVRNILEAAAKVRPQAARGDGADVLAEREAIIARLERARQIAGYEEHKHLGAEGEHRWGLVKTVLRDEIAAIRARSAPQPSNVVVHRQVDRSLIEQQCAHYGGALGEERCLLLERDWTWRGSVPERCKLCPMRLSPQPSHGEGR